MKSLLLSSSSFVGLEGCIAHSEIMMSKEAFCRGVQMVGQLGRVTDVLEY